jgi:hypothetical protein
MALALVGGTAVQAAASSSTDDTRRPRVRVATTGNESERVKTLRITRESGAEKRVVISLGPSGLPDLAPGDRVRITAELMVTTNCVKPVPRCRGPSYGYNPRIRARLVLAPSGRAKAGPRTMPISKLKRETCTQRRPQYEHHCVFVFAHAGFDVHRSRRFPCAIQACHVNLIADVHHPRASSGDLLIVGGLRPSGKILQDRGGINAVRYRDVLPSDFEETATDHLHRRRMPPDLERRVVISRRLAGLERGEQLAVQAAMRTDISHLPYAVRTSARLILAESPRATKPGEFVKAHALGTGEISENNGSNCTKPPGRCTYRKVGVLEMRRDAVDGRDRPVPLYINLVTVLGPKVREARARDRVRFRRSEIRVVRFPPRLHG